jgi:hypothetical protein
MTIEILPDEKKSESESLIRFIELHKLISLIRQKTLFFTRLDLLPDPFEGVTTTLIKQRYLAKLIPSRERMNPKLPAELIEENLRQKENTEKYYDEEAIRKQKSQFVNCWSKGDRESMAMWNLYSNKESVAIKIQKNELLDYLKNNLELQPLLYPDFQLICGSVKYYELNPVNLKVVVKVPYSAFKKDIAFEFENEYRLLIVSPLEKNEDNPSKIELNITGELLNKMEIICHPEMSDWQFDNIKELCQKIKFKNVRKSLIEMK